MKLYLNIFLGFLCCLSFTAKASVISFEQGNDPTWSTSKGSISITDQKAKLGDKSLAWQWQADDLLTYENASLLNAVSAQKQGGVMMWVYNDTPIADYMQLAFRDQNKTLRCYKDFSLNFTGWRCFMVRMTDDMLLPSKYKGAIAKMSIRSPKSGSGTLLLDFIEFQNSVSWERMSDFQYTVTEAAGIDSYLNCYKYIRPQQGVVTSEKEAAIAKINQRIDQWYTGTQKYAADPLYKKREQAIQQYIQSALKTFPSIAANGTINQSGLFPQYFLNKSYDGHKTLTFREVNEGYLLQLALDYRINKRESSLEQLQQLYQLYREQGWAVGSALGTLRFEMLRSAGIYHSLKVVGDAIDSDLRTHFDQAQPWFNRLGDIYLNPKHPGELADFLRALAVPKLYTILRIEDAAERTHALERYQAYMNNALCEAPGFLGSIKPDGSGYHHRSPYYSAYYPDVLYATSMIYYLLADTPFALSEASFANLKKSLLAFQFFSAKYDVPGATTGRFPAQTTILQQILPAFAYLIAATDDHDLKSAFKAAWDRNDADLIDYIEKARTDICLSNMLGEVEILLDAENASLQCEPRCLTGSSYMPYSGLLTYRYADWMLTIKGYSKYIWDYEATATENPYGRYISYAHHEYSHLTKKQKSYDVVSNDAKGNTDWDWQHLTGTTTRVIAKDALHYKSTEKQRNYSTSPFLGGIAFDAHTALFSNQIIDTRLTQLFTADKTTFIFDNLIFALGSNIADQEGANYYATSLFQHKRNGQNIVVNNKEVTATKQTFSQPVLNDNFGNLFIVHQGDVVVENTSQVNRAYIHHGDKTVQQPAYAYSWIIQPTAEQIEEYQNDHPVEVLSHSKIAHIVRHKAKQTTMAAIFNASGFQATAQLMAVDKPMLVVLKETEGNKLHVAVSNPDMDRPSGASLEDLSDVAIESPGRKSDLILTLKGAYELTTPAEQITTEVLQGNTRITVKDAFDSQTYHIHLQPIQTAIDQTSGHDLVIKQGQDYIHLSTTATQQSQWELINTQGVCLMKGLFTHHTAIQTATLLKGNYVIRVTNDTHTITRQINL